MGEGCCGVRSSGHDVAMAIMNSEQLWSPAQDRPKIKTANILA